MHTSKLATHAQLKSFVNPMTASKGASSSPQKSETVHATPGEVEVVTAAFAHTLKRAHNHYENFPVVSWLLPRAMHRPILTLYAYCRTVDDLGDEATGDRLRLLAIWEQLVRSCFDRGGTTGGDIAALVPLRELITHFSLPLQPFLDLIEANRMDQIRQRYDTFDELLFYCKHSANPVGRLFLALFDYHDETRQALSDEICTGLQLTNFWQDVARDAKMGRVYLPLSDLKRFGYTEERLFAGVVDSAFVNLIRFQVQRTYDFFERGRPLLAMLDNNCRHHVELFSRGGKYILDQIAARRFDVLSGRPVLPKWRKAWMIGQAALSALGGGRR